MKISEAKRILKNNGYIINESGNFAMKPDLDDIKESISMEYDDINCVEWRNVDGVDYIFAECEMPEDGEYCDACRGSQPGNVSDDIEGNFKGYIANTDEDVYGHRIFVIYNCDELAARFNDDEDAMDKWVQDILEVG